MCVQIKPIFTSGCDNASEESTSSSARGNTIRSRYQVLGRLSRGSRLSVDRDCAGRNAKPKGSSVKGSSPDKLIISVVAEPLLRSEGSTESRNAFGTTGVQAHGMYRRQILELERSLESRTGKIRFNGQEIKFKSKINLTREVRWPRSSWEVG